MENNYQNLNIYFAGELLTHKDLTGNAMLAEAITELSDQRYCCVLPQNFAKQGHSSYQNREQDLLNLIESDVVLFNFDGTELDSGTVVEFMTAKFADIPSVIIRTDDQESEDQGNVTKHLAWNIMANFHQRCQIEIIDAVSVYKNLFSTFPMVEATEVLIEKRSSDVSRAMIRVIAQAIIDAFDKVIQQPKVLAEKSAEAVYDWLGRFAKYSEGGDETSKRLLGALKRKQDKGLL